ncbi:hypothetical protein ACP70R_003845 [Stipagrostis hirtigluma subsp. patula]
MPPPPPSLGHRSVAASSSSAAAMPPPPPPMFLGHHGAGSSSSSAAAMELPSPTTPAPSILLQPPRQRIIGALYENWGDIADMLQLRPLDCSFLFPCEQVHILACLSASKHDTQKCAVLRQFKILLFLLLFYLMTIRDLL